MKQQKICGYICTKEEQVLRRCVAPIGLIMIVLFACVLWLEAFQSRTSIALWLFAFCWSAFVACLIVSYRRIRIADRLAFCIEQNIISNSWPPENRIEIDLCESFFYTMLTLEFGYGKAVGKKTVYLFSEKPFPSDGIEADGLIALEKVNKSNIIIIPKTEETGAYLENNLCLKDIPVYPTIAFKARGDSSGKYGDGLREP